MIGSTLSHYTITATLGSGGMGGVYRATDTRLGRAVALKVLPAEMAVEIDRLERFRREARAVAALNHPNIVTLYSVEEDQGTHFLTMELVEGHTLAREIDGSGLAIDRFFELACPLASAVAAAHAKGITHRDLKPANVMVTEDGRVKVLDFGLAKLAENPEPLELTQMPTEAMTQEGVILGTIPYMSPEQVEGKPLDPRSDIFSLGILLYEMATGMRPFVGDTQPGLMSSILRDAPTPILEIRQELPRHLGRIVIRCLEKSPQLRYEHAGSLAYELEGLRREVDSGVGSPSSVSVPSSSEPGKKSIAVLPFVNRSGNPDDEYFSDGLSEELILALGKLHGLKVTARASAFQFRGREIDVRKVGEKLSVDTVLEGSVRIAGNRLRIAVELVNCADGYQLWTERFDAEMKDIFDTQDEIARAIVEQLEVELGSRAGQRLVKQETGNLEAYHLLLRARARIADFFEPSLIEAVGYLEQAVELDPACAAAYAEMSYCYILRSLFGTFPGNEAFDLVRVNTQRALALDPESAVAHSMEGLYRGFFLQDWRGAEEEARKALTLSPQTVFCHVALTCVTALQRRHTETVAGAERILELDPLGRFSRSQYAVYQFYGNRNADAERACLEGLDLFPDYWVLHYFLVHTYWQRGDKDRAIASGLKCVELTGDAAPSVMTFVAAVHFTFGEVAEGERLLNRAQRLAETSYLSSGGLAIVEIARERTDEAIAWLERASAEHDMIFPWVRAACELFGIIADERIRHTMERLGLP